MTKPKKEKINKIRKQTKKLSLVVNYPVGDFLIRIKNAKMARLKEIEAIKTNLVKEVATALKREGFIDEIQEKEGKLKVRITYHSKSPLITNIKLISRPGLRVYMGVDELLSHRGPELFIVSTSKGVLSSNEAIKRRLGGEIIAKVW